MKNYFLLFFALLFSAFLFGQDTIYKRGGDIVIAKITELTPSEIKYKRFDFQDGPTYIELKSNIEWVKYSNGLKETFKKEEVVKPVQPYTPADYYAGGAAQNNKISIRGSRYYYKNDDFNEREIQDVLLDTKNKNIMAYVTKSQQAKKMKYIAFAAIPLGVAGLFALASSTTFSYYGTQRTDNGLLTLGGFCIAAAIACPITSGAYNQKKKEYNRKAVKLYNETY